MDACSWMAEAVAGTIPTPAEWPEDRVVRHGCPDTPPPPPIEYLTATEAGRLAGIAPTTASFRAARLGLDPDRLTVDHVELLRQPVPRFSAKAAAQG